MGDLVLVGRLRRLVHPALLALAAGLFAAPVSVAAAAPEIAQSPALQSLAACLGEKKTGDLVVLIDTSGSLSGTGSSEPATDPTDVRVAGAQALLGGLARSFDQVGAAVDVTVAGFDDDVTPAVGFTPLNQAALPDLDGQLAAFADRDRGAETDYWSALTWLNRTLQDKAAQRPGGPGSTCQFAIWFTDGEFTIWPRDGSSSQDLDPLTNRTKDIPGFEDVPLTDAATAEDAKNAAMQELCRPGGPADQMRASDITLIGVGLGGNDGDRFSFMRDYIENPAGGCGAEPGRGVFVPADSVGDLFLALAAVGEIDQTPITEGPNPICQGQPCPEGTYTFKLDNTISAVHLDAVVDDGSRALIRSGIQVTITPPTGAPIVIDGDGPDSGAAPSTLASATYEWYTGGPLSVDLDRADGQDWTGDWKVTFVDTTGQHPDAVSNIALTLTSDFAIQPIPEPETWRVGQSAAVRFEPQTLDGTPIRLTELPAGFTATAEVTFPGPDRPVQQIPLSLTDPTTIDVPADGSAGLAIVVAKVDGQVAGQPLATVARQVTVAVQPPFDAPTVALPNQVVDFGAVEGPVSASGTLTMQGPEQGDGCVTVAAGEVQGPRDVSARIATPNGYACFPVAAGQQVQVPLTLTPSAEGNGRLTGDMVVSLAPADDPQRVSDQQVAFRLDMTRLPNPGARLGVLIAALLIGLLIPVLVMWLVRRMSARFPRAEAAVLQSIALDVRVGAGRLTAQDGGQLAVPQDGWSAVPPPGPGRRTLMLSGVPLRARAGWRLSEPGYAEVDDRTGADSVGTGDALPPHDGKGRPRLPLAVQGTWLLLAARQLAVSPIDAVQARLMLVIDTAADDAKRAELAGRAVAEAPEAFEQARRLAREASGAPEPPPPPTPVPAGGGWDSPPTGPAASGPSQAGSAGWGSGSGQPSPGWGATGPPTTGGGWGPPPPSGGSGTAPGWGNPPPGGRPDDGRRDHGWPG